MMALVMNAPPPEVDRATLERARARDPMALRMFVVRYERRASSASSVACSDRDRTSRTSRRRRFCGHSARSQPSTPKGRRRLPRGFSPLPRAWLSMPERRSVCPSNQWRPLSGSATRRRRRRSERASDLGRRLANAAAELSDDHRAALLLADVHGFTTDEVATALSIPENTAKTRLFRARRHMRERLEAMDREDRHGSE